jgi:hypothetical protein
MRRTWALFHRHAAEWLRVGSFARVWRFILLSLAGKRNKAVRCPGKPKLDHYGPFPTAHS